MLQGDLSCLVEHHIGREEARNRIKHQIGMYAGQATEQRLKLKWCGRNSISSGPAQPFYTQR